MVDRWKVDSVRRRKVYFSDVHEDEERVKMRTDLLCSGLHDTQVLSSLVYDDEKQFRYIHPKPFADILSQPHQPLLQLLHPLLHLLSIILFSLLSFFNDSLKLF